MSILHRMARLVRADFHAALDRWEEPQAQLKQALREMAEILAAWELQAQQLAQSIQRNQQQIQRQQQAVQTLNQQLQLSLDQDREDLARPLLRRRLLLEQLIAQGEQQLLQDQAQQTQLQQNLEQGREQWRLLQLQQPQTEDDDSSEARTWAVDSLPGSNAAWVSDHEVELALLRERQQRAQAKPATAACAAETTGQSI